MVVGVNQRAHGGIQYYGLSRKKKAVASRPRVSIRTRKLSTAPTRDRSLEKLRTRIGNSRLRIKQASPASKFKAQPPSATASKPSGPKAKQSVPKRQSSKSIGELITQRVNQAGGRIRRADVLRLVVDEVMSRPDLKCETRWDTHVKVGKVLDRYLRSGHLFQFDDLVCSAKVWKKLNRNSTKIYESPTVRMMRLQSR